MSHNQPHIPNYYSQGGITDSYLDSENPNFPSNQEGQVGLASGTYESVPADTRTVDKLREQFTVCTIYSEDEENPQQLAGFMTDSNMAPNRNPTNIPSGSPRPGGSAGEAERRRDAWIPGPRTLRILQEVAAGGVAALPEGEALTMPGVILDCELGDPVGEMVAHYLGEGEASKRKVLTANDVTQDDRGLCELIRAGCLRAAVNLTGRLLSVYGQGRGRAGHPAKHTPHSLQLWFTRLALLVRLRTFGTAVDEAAAFDPCLDRPDLYFAFRPELHGDRTGSVAPFALRLLVAELPAYVPSSAGSGGGCERALDNLYALLSTVEKVLLNLRGGLREDGAQVALSEDDRSKSIQLWSERRKRVLFSVTNCAVYAKDYELAVKTLLPLVEEAEKEHQGNGRALRSALGRLLLQLGDVAGAEQNFSLARRIGGGGTKAEEVRELIDRGLVAVAQNAFREALTYFRKTLQLDPSNVLVSNNVAVCLLYLGRLREALEVAEAAIEANPSLALHESVLLNVCTLYELRSACRARSKVAMLRLLATHKGDGVHPGCLKLHV
ncbi:trafficking protein particle complex subunit 12 [Hetaerina americana]|uniref:trafficking protein particle complex subunit 12 n=1 Tax=Hetaerina americana TaxID=62018 RepID=UPI003A7F4433